MVSPFLYTVEEIQTTFPHYSSIIKKPIDLVQIKNRLAEGDYEDVDKMNEDMSLMFKNATTFNPKGEPVHDAALGFKQLWEDKWKSLPPKVEPRDESEDPVEESVEPDQSDVEDGECTSTLTIAISR